MPTDRLPNYLRMHRKRSGLSQEEVAFLLGAKDGSAVCRHERRKQTPNARTLLAYEILFHAPIRDLYGGTRSEVETGLLRRARLLLEKLMRAGRGRRTARKIETLLTLVTPGAAPKPGT
jgi:DNA-binding XRE family transcriptional regulator